MPLAKNSRILCDFRGMPFVESFSKNRDTNGEPMRADSLANAIVAEISEKLRKSSTTEILRSNWDNCIDKRFVGKCGVYKVSGNVAFISTINAQVKQNIVFSEKKILLQISKIDGCKGITKIRFI